MKLLVTLALFGTLAAVAAASIGAGASSAQSPSTTATPGIAASLTPIPQTADFCKDPSIQVVLGGRQITFGRITATLPSNTWFGLGETRATISGDLFLTICDETTGATVWIGEYGNVVGGTASTGRSSPAIDRVIASRVMPTPSVTPPIGLLTPFPTPVPPATVVVPPSTGDGGLK